MIEQQIKANISNPKELEQLYQTDKKGFSKAFLAIYPELANFKIADFWKARLEYIDPKALATKVDKKAIFGLILTCLLTAFLIKLPQIFNFDPDTYFFYQKNIGLIVFLGLSVFALFTSAKLNARHFGFAIFSFIVATIYINLLPSTENSDSVVLSFIHLPLFLWSVYGLIFMDFDVKDKPKRIDYIKYNGDLAILSAIILISGGVTTGVTLGLFGAIDLDIEEFYFNNIVVPGLVCVPILATYIIKIFPSITNKIAPIIASIFGPVVLLTLIVYLVSMGFAGKDPYNDRDFLIIFNLMLLGVMAIISFSVSETSVSKKQPFNEWTLFILSIVTLIVDIIALSAIIYRMGEYGLSPNRVAVLGSNLLIFGNLVLIMIDLYKVCFKGNDLKKVELTIAKYLPIYTAWTIFMTFVLPLLFGFK